MVLSSDEHLEIALKDYNDKVNKLEESGTPEELLDAYINRGCVLSMMEYYVSALSDFDEAAELIDKFEANGVRIDAGTYVKTYVSRGEIQGGDDMRSMAEDYAKAAKRLPDLKEDSKYYDRKKIINMCIACTEGLVDEKFPAEIDPFVEKCYSYLIAKEDAWSNNRYIEIVNLRGQASMDLFKSDEAIECFSSAIDSGIKLLEEGKLDDVMSLVFPYVSRGDVEQQEGLLEPYFADRKAAIVLLEELLSANKLDDIKVLVTLHQDLANTYLTLNKMKEAEEHLMREVELDVNGAREYIRNFADRHPDKMEPPE